MKSDVLVGAGQLELAFDPDVLKLSQVHGGELLSSAMLDSHVATEGHLKIAFVASDVLKSTGGLLAVEMKSLAPVSTDTTFRIEKVRMWKADDSSEVVAEFSKDAVLLEITSETDGPQRSVEVQDQAEPAEGLPIDNAVPLPRWILIVGAAGGITILFLLVLYCGGLRNVEQVMCFHHAK
jgi:hypothetical protein